MSKAYELKPWTKVVTPHDDILGGDFDMSSYAANLGQVDVGGDKCPDVYKDPVAFYKATYRTKALDELLGGVASVLSGKAGNRVLQLRTPFGGGKTHTLIALLHLFRHRKALDKAGVVEGYADPGPARVATLPCLDLSAAAGRQVDGIHVRTLWGELAIRLGGPKAYQIVKEADERRVMPGGDSLRTLLGDKPTVLLLDEVLVYVEAALGVEVAKTNLGRQTMTFIQTLTETVRALPRCVMVYSLQQSVREAVGNEGLLDMLDALVSRLDAKKEPVSGDDVLRVVQRRLFKDIGPEAVREAVAKEYAELHRQFLTQDAQNESEKRAAADEAETLRRRILDAYPFHPELLDLMYHRWGSLPTYQRTRGALQFLATVIGALWNSSDAVSPLIGPGDVTLKDNMVRNTFFSQVGERDAMKSVLDSDLLGATARCRRVDEAVAADVPAYKTLKVGTRLTRALALYSFGAKPGEDRGVLRRDLLAACQMPGLTADVLDVALQGLSDTLLYIHNTGRRWRFEKKPNLNKLVDDEAKKYEAAEVLEGVRGELEARLDAKDGFVIWPADSGGVLDRKPRFQVVFLGPDQAMVSAEKLEKLVRNWTDNCGGGKRNYRNALAFALPNAQALDNARAAARRTTAVQALLDDKKRHGFDAEDVHDLEGRKTRASTDLVAAIRQMYTTILLPVAAPKNADDPVRLERLEIQSHQALGTAGVLKGMYEAMKNWVFEDAVPGKVVSSVHLGDGDIGSRGHYIGGPELVDQFFGSVHFPKLLTLAGLQATVAKGVDRGTFGYIMGATESKGTLRLLGPDSLTMGEEVAPADIDLSDGSYIVSATFAKTLRQSVREPDGVPYTATEKGGGGGSQVTPPGVTVEKPPTTSRTQPITSSLDSVQLQFQVARGKLFDTFQALEYLSEWATGEFTATVTIHAAGEKPLGRNDYEMHVLGPLEEADAKVVKS